MKNKNPYYVINLIIHLTVIFLHVEGYLILIKSIFTNKYLNVYTYLSFILYSTALILLYRDELIHYGILKIRNKLQSKNDIKNIKNILITQLYYCLITKFITWIISILVVVYCIKNNLYFAGFISFVIWEIFIYYYDKISKEIIKYFK